MATQARPSALTPDADKENSLRAITASGFGGGVRASGFTGGQIDTGTKNLRPGYETDVGRGDTPTEVKPPPVYSPAPTYTPAPTPAPAPKPVPVPDPPPPTIPAAPPTLSQVTPAVVAPPPAPTPAPAPAPPPPPADTVFNDTRGRDTVTVTAPTMPTAAEQWAMNQYQAAQAWNNFYQQVAQRNAANMQRPQTDMQGNLSTK